MDLVKFTFCLTGATYLLLKINESTLKPIKITEINFGKRYASYELEYYMEKYIQKETNSGYIKTHFKKFNHKLISIGPFRNKFITTYDLNNSSLTISEHTTFLSRLFQNDKSLKITNESFKDFIENN